MRDVMNWNPGPWELTSQSPHQSVDGKKSQTTTWDEKKDLEIMG